MIYWQRDYMAIHKILQSQAYLNDPYPFLENWRSNAPLIPSKIPILGPVWFTTTQSAAAMILKDTARFSVRKPDGRAVGEAWWMPRMISKLTNNMLSTDEPDHTRLRRVVDHAFQRRAVNDMDKAIQSMADTLAEPLKQAAQSFDLISSFARPFPLIVICELLGLPEADYPKFSKWAQSITNVTGIISFLFSVNKLRPLTDYIDARIALEREHGGVGLIHEIVNVSEEKLTHDELVAMVFLLLLAGHETTAHLISGGVYALLTNPEQLALLRREPERLDVAVEELLRFVSPVQMTKPRYVREACEVEGVALRRGDLVMPLLIAANYDPAVFDNPEQLNIERKPNRHMEFGTGSHFCLGHQLARAEMKAAVRSLLLSDISFELAFPVETVRWNQRLGLRSLRSLMVSAAPHHQQ